MSTTIAPGTQQVITTAPAQGSTIPGHLLNDADSLYAANELGLGKDLGLISKEAPKAGATEPGDSATAAPGLLDTNSAGAAVVVAKPGEETKEQKIARVEKELAELKGTVLPAAGTESATGAAAPVLPALPVVMPTAGNPLVNLRNAEQFKVSEQAARELKDWAFKNRDGGTLPVNLLQLVENAEAQRVGREPVQVTTGVEIDGDKATELFSSAERLLTQYLPERKQQAQVEAGAMQLAQKTAPKMFDTKTEEGKTFQQFVKGYPGLMQSPDWPLLMRDLVTGYLANKAAGTVQASAPAGSDGKKGNEGKAAAGATVEDQDGKLVPFAPAAPLGGGAPAAIPASQREIDASYARLRAGKATDEDLTILGAAAV